MTRDARECPSCCVDDPLVEPNLELLVRCHLAQGDQDYGCKERRDVWKYGRKGAQRKGEKRMMSGLRIETSESCSRTVGWGWRCWHSGLT